MINAEGKFVWNCYVGACAPTEQEAREMCVEEFHAADHTTNTLRLVHVEPGEDEEESPTFIFAFWSDGGHDEVEDMLHDLYMLDELPNLPIEVI